jgi:hypothetical protein
MNVGQVKKPIKEFDTNDVCNYYNVHVTMARMQQIAAGLEEPYGLDMFLNASCDLQ